MKENLYVVILTFNEEIHIRRAIENVMPIADKVLVLDSYSTDRTVDICRSLQVDVLFRKFDNYKNQRLYAIDFCKEKANWVLFLDADEYLSPSLKEEMTSSMKDESVSGFYLPRKFIFMNKWIRYGGYFPIYLLRLFRPEFSFVEREINEHILVTGITKKMKHCFFDHNLKGISFWIDKHNKYATFEANYLFNMLSSNKRGLKKYSFSSQSSRKLWIRDKIWNKLPLLFKPFLYYLYRYFFRIGFLDGWQGFVFHFLHALWFRFLIDLKYIEMKQNEKIKSFDVSQ